MRLGRKLAKHRIEHRLSRQAVSEKLGVQAVDIKNWERAKEWPDHEALVKLAAIYEVPVEEFTSIIELETGYDQTFWGNFPFQTIVLISFFLIFFLTPYAHPGWIILFLMPLYRKTGEYLLKEGKLPMKK